MDYWGNLMYFRGTCMYYTGIFFDYGICAILTIFLDFLKKSEEFPNIFRAKSALSPEKRGFSTIYRILYGKMRNIRKIYFLDILHFSL